MSLGGVSPSMQSWQRKSKCDLAMDEVPEARPLGKGRPDNNDKADGSSRRQDVKDGEASEGRKADGGGQKARSVSVYTKSLAFCIKI